ncbi:36091_t:CDS:1, partial [Racocetra persica]
MLPRFSIFQQEYSLGGLRTPVVEYMLEARLMTMWIKLLTADNLWAKVERSLISNNIRDKCNVSVKDALNSTSINLKGWPESWKIYVKAWKKLEGRVCTNTEAWPWSLADISLAQLKEEEYSVKKATKFLRGKFLKLT